MGKARNREKLIETLRADKLSIDTMLKRTTHKLCVCSQRYSELQQESEQMQVEINMLEDFIESIANELGCESDFNSIQDTIMRLRR